MSAPVPTPRQRHRPDLLRRYPLACYFVGTYVVAWCLWAPLVIVRDGLPPAVGFVLALLGSLVPSTVAILLIAINDGKGGVRRLLARLLKWRVGVRWYLVVLVLPLLVPLGLSLSVLLGGATPTIDAPLIAVLITFVFSIFPGSALGEELGWRGFALPHLQDTRSALGASLILGPLWGCWDLPLFLADTQSRPLGLFPAFVCSAIALSVLLTWIYNSTAGSLLLVVLLHATFNLPITLLIAPLGTQMIQPFLISTALLILTAAAVVGMTGPAHLSRTQRKQTTNRAAAAGATTVPTS